MPLLDPKTDVGRISPYVEDIKQAAHEAGIEPAILAAVCLRESLAGWALTPRGTHLGWGDGGHGWGLCQADDRSWKAWILSPEACTPRGQFTRAAQELAANWRILALAFPLVHADLIERGSIAGYNARLGAVAMQIAAGRDVDAVTTAGPSGKGDYSGDVLARAKKLVDLGVFPAPGQHYA